MYFIAIDVGSSYIKSVLLNLDERLIVEEAKQATPSKKASPNPRVFEIPMKEIYQTVEGIIAGYCTRYPNVEGVLFSTQMHGCVYSDPAYGEDIYLSWQDTRCLDEKPGTRLSYMEYLRTLFPAERMQSTGVEIKPALALCNLYVLLEERKFQISPAATLYTLGSYLIAGLTGRNICHIQNAAPMGMVNLEKAAWRDDILLEAGMGTIAMPEIVTGFESCGTGHIAGTSFAVYPDFGDQQMSVLGCFANAGDMILNIATGAQVILLQQGFRLGKHEIRPFFEETYCNVVSRMPAGRNLDVFMEFFREIAEKVSGTAFTRDEVWSRIQEFMTLEDTQGLQANISTYELPHQLADGSISHITHYNLTLQNTLSALLQDMGRVYARYIGELCGEEGLKGRLIFSGGAALNTPAIMRAIEREIAMVSEPAPLKNEVHAGMFRAAQLCTGRCKSLRETSERKLLL